MRMSSLEDIATISRRASCLVLAVFSSRISLKRNCKIRLPICTHCYELSVSNLAVSSHKLLSYVKDSQTLGQDKACSSENWSYMYLLSSGKLTWDPIVSQHDCIKDSFLVKIKSPCCSTGNAVCQFD